MKTYQVLDINKKEILGYYRRLCDAQSFVVRNFDQRLIIRSLVGQYFGEGFHSHEWYFNASKLTFKRQYLR